MGGWMGDHAHVCFIMKIILNLIMKWVVVDMSYTLDLIFVSIGIIESFQLVSILTSLCILIYVVCFIYVCLFFTQYQFQLVSYFKPMHIFFWYFIKGEKTRILYFNWYLVHHCFCFPLPNFMLNND